MIIGIDIRSLMTREYSGIPEYTLRLLQEVLLQDRDNQYRLFFNSARDLSKYIPVFSSPNTRVVNTRFPNRVFNLIMQKNLKFPKIDRMLNCDLFFMPNINFISLSGECKKVITVHDLSFLKHKEHFSLKRIIWHNLVNVKKTLSQFERIIAVSESTREDLIDLCDIEPNRISVIYSGVSEVFQKRSQDDKFLAKVKNKYNLPDKFILHLGTIEPRKNLKGVISAYDHLLSVYKEMGEYKLVIAGGDGWKNADIYKYINNAEQSSNIRQIGFVDKEDKSYLYNLAEIFVYPSHYEGFGFPPLEAMASGTPVVTSSVSSLPEVVGDAALMVNPNNHRELSNAFSLILSDNKLKEQMTAKGLARASNFNWKKTARAYIDLFNN